MLDDDTTQASAPTAGSEPAAPVVKTTTRKRATRTTKKAATAPEATAPVETPAAAAAEAPAEKPVKKAAAKKAAAKKAPAKKAAAKKAPAKKATKAAEPADDAQGALDLGAGESAASETTEAPAAPVVKKTTRKRTTKKAAAAPVEAAEAVVEAVVEATAETTAGETPEAAPAKKAPAKRTRKAAAKKVAAAPADAATDAATETVQDAAPVEEAAAPAVKKTTRKRTTKKAAAAPVEVVEAVVEPAAEDASDSAPAAPMALFQVPAAEPKVTTRRRSTRKVAAIDVTPVAPVAEEETVEDEALEADVEAVEETTDAPEGAEATESAESAENADENGEEGDDTDENGDDAEDSSGNGRRRRRRGGRRRRRSGGSDNDTETNASDENAESGEDEATETAGENGDSDSDEGQSSSRRRRRRRRAGDSDAEGSDDPENTVTRVRKGRALEDQITAVTGSTRLEAKKQRRREGREAGRRRAPIISEAEFLARREAVDRQMVIRQREELTQIGVLEDKVLVEHYVARESQTSMIGNVYLGRVQNVLPSMEAAFIDIGKGRNAVLYAGEVNWAALGHKDGAPRKIESVLSSGQSILVQVTKDPIGHKGARLTSQVSLAGRFLVYVPDGTNSGISRKLSDTERSRLKKLLKEIVPEHAGVIVRTAAEGASEEELTQDVERLKARWADIEAKAGGGAQGPKLLYGEPDLTLKVVRDLFTEDFSKLIIEGEDAWETVQDYVQHVAPDLLDRVEKFSSPTEGRDQGKDIFGVHRIEEQIHKGLDRKVWLPSGGSLIIDRTEAMTVIDVNTGKFTGSGGNLEETVTKNNLEAAEEVVRQLRLRDIGGIIVVDFIDMVLESNRDLVVRRLVECLGRDRTRHQVAEVTSLGLVQMTRKRIGTGLLETFGVDCDHCHGRGMVISDQPVEPRRSPAEEDNNRRSNSRNRRGRGRGDSAEQDNGSHGSDDSKADVVDTADTEGAQGRNEARSEGRGEGRGRRRGQRHDAPAAAAPSPADVAAAARPAGESVENDVEPVAPEVVEHAPVETAAVEAAPVEAPGEAAPAPVEAVEQESHDTAPKVTRRTRRSRRGSETVVVTPSEATPVVEPVVEAAVEAAVESEPAPVVAAEPQEDLDQPSLLDAVEDAPAASEAPEQPEQPEAATAPRVVTRTRRRSATRPAGPPVVGAETASAASETTGEGAAEGAASSEETVAHVPLKKKGSRKR